MITLNIRLLLSCCNKYQACMRFVRYLVYSKVWFSAEEIGLRKEHQFCVICCWIIQKPLLFLCAYYKHDRLTV